MYLHMPKSQKRKRNKANRLRGKLKAKNRRRTNRMYGKKPSSKRPPAK